MERSEIITVTNEKPNKAGLDNRWAALSAIRSVTLTRRPVSALTPAPAVPALKRSQLIRSFRVACSLTFGQENRKPPQHANYSIFNSKVWLGRFSSGSRGSFYSLGRHLTKHTHRRRSQYFRIRWRQFCHWMGDDCDLNDHSRIHSATFGLGTHEQGFCWSMVFCGFDYLERDSFDRLRTTAANKTKLGVHWRVNTVLAPIVY